MRQMDFIYIISKAISSNIDDCRHVLHNFYIYQIIFILLLMKFYSRKIISTQYTLILYTQNLLIILFDVIKILNLHN